MRIYIYIVVFVIIMSCTSKESNNRKESVQIYGNQILKDYFEIQELFVLDSLLLTKNHPSSKNLFSLFSKNEDFIMGFGQLGGGPSDFEEQVSFNNQVYYNKEKDLCIWLYEIHHHRLRLINIDKTIERGTTYIEQDIDINPNLNMENVFYLDSMLVVGNVNNLDIYMDKLRFYNPILKKIEKHFFLSPQVKRGSGRDIGWVQYDYNSLFVNKLCYYPNRGFVSVMMEMDRMDLMNTEGEVIKIVADKYTRDSYSYTDFPKKEERTIFYLDVVATDENLYTLYNGVNSYKNLDLKKNIIKIYNWRGELIKCFNPQEALYRITVDENNNIIYGISENNNEVYKYDLGKITEK